MFHRSSTYARSFMEQSSRTSHERIKTTTILVLWQPGGRKSFCSGIFKLCYMEGNNLMLLIWFSKSSILIIFNFIIKRAENILKTCYQVLELVTLWVVQTVVNQLPHDNYFVLGIGIRPDFERPINVQILTMRRVSRVVRRPHQVGQLACLWSRISEIENVFWPA